MTKFQEHAVRWRDCRRCPLCEGRTRVVLARGSVPCQVLFVGEAPGESEDVLGRPFVGPAGALLDQVLARALPAGTTYALTNVVSCIPRAEDGGKSTEQPEYDSIRACAPRLQEFYELCRPRLVVAVGALARDWLDTKVYPPLYDFVRRVPIVDIHHPAFILRALPITKRGILVQKCVVTIKTALRELETLEDEVRAQQERGPLPKRRHSVRDEEIPF